MATHFIVSEGIRDL